MSFIKLKITTSQIIFLKNAHGHIIVVDEYFTKREKKKKEEIWGLPLPTEVLEREILLVTK